MENISVYNNIVKHAEKPTTNDITITEANDGSINVIFANALPKVITKSEKAQLIDHCTKSGQFVVDVRSNDKTTFLTRPKPDVTTKAFLLRGAPIGNK